MPKLNETNLSVGFTLLNTCPLGDFESSLPISPKLKVDFPECNLNAERDFCSATFMHASPIEIGLTIDSPHKVLIIADTLLSPAPLGEPMRIMGMSIY